FFFLSRKKKQKNTISLQCVGCFSSSLFLFYFKAKLQILNVFPNPERSKMRSQHKDAIQGCAGIWDVFALFSAGSQR
uniref:Uncharacterized protein n=1 Tax=Coturnix japonica TaxID=93934 RepID=A0A8C2SKG5_COTJA